MSYEELMDLENELVNNLGNSYKEEYKAQLKEYKEAVDIRTSSLINELKKED